jgi:hypothetical protein
MNKAIALLIAALFSSGASAQMSDDSFDATVVYDDSQPAADQFKIDRVNIPSATTGAMSRIGNQLVAMLDSYGRDYVIPLKELTGDHQQSTLPLDIVTAIDYGSRSYYDIEGMNIAVTDNYVVDRLFPFGRRESEQRYTLNSINYRASIKEGVTLKYGTYYLGTQLVSLNGPVANQFTVVNLGNPYAFGKETSGIELTANKTTLSVHATYGYQGSNGTFLGIRQEWDRGAIEATAGHSILTTEDIYTNTMLAEKSITDSVSIAGKVRVSHDVLLSASYSYGTTKDTAKRTYTGGKYDTQQYGIAMEMANVVDNDRLLVGISSGVHATRGSQNYALFRGIDRNTFEQVFDDVRVYSKATNIEHNLEARYQTGRFEWIGIKRLNPSNLSGDDSFVGVKYSLTF